MAVVGSGGDGNMGKAVPAFSGFVSISQTSCPATSYLCDLVQAREAVYQFFQLSERGHRYGLESI